MRKWGSKSKLHRRVLRIQENGVLWCVGPETVVWVENISDQQGKELPKEATGVVSLFLADLNSMS